MMQNNHQEWLAKSEEDEFACEEIIGGNRFAAPACFHAHQMAEKLLKGLMVYYRIDFPKTHDLVALAEMLEPKATDIQSNIDDLKFLTTFYFETRYPGDYPEFTLDEAREALESARNIKDYVLDKIDKKK